MLVNCCRACTGTPSSSAGEPAHAVRSPQPLRLPLQLEGTMRTRYRIDRFQQTYFVIDILTSDLM